MWRNPGVAALASGLLAQAAKVLVELAARRRWRPGLFLANGGMPSSHAATVTTLTLLVGRLEGYASSVFSLVLVFSLFVVFEATGLRQEIGKQAELLNELLEGGFLKAKFRGRQLRELVGHTWAEVAGGVLVGVLVYLWLGPQAGEP